MTRDLVIFIGNRLFGDDKVALLVGEKLKESLESIGVDVEIVERMGFSLVDLIAGRDIVVIVDSIKSGKFRVGDVFEVTYLDYDSYTPFSPHYVGLPEALKIVKELDLGTPKRVCVIGIEVKDPYTISEDISEELKNRFKEVVSNVFKKILECLERG